MIVNLSVANFAIIDSLSLSLEPGFTVLTGETGAGKSLIIDAISLLLGEKGSRLQVRYGATEARVSGRFVSLSAAAREALQCDAPEALVERVIRTDGTSSARLNGKAVSLSRLAKAAPWLCDIHDQRGFESVLDPKNYLALLDGTSALLVAYHEAYRLYTRTARELKEFSEKARADREQLDYLRYRIAELDRAALSPEEEETLKTRARLSAHRVQVQEALSGLASALATTDELYQGTKALDTLLALDPSYDAFKTRFENDYYDLVDLQGELEKKSQAFSDGDENDDEAMNERLGLYADLKRKYGKSVAELVASLSRMKQELDAFENYDEIVKTKTAAFEAARKELYAKGLALHEARVLEARTLETTLTRELADLELAKAVFQVSFAPIAPDEENAKFYSSGLDEVDFLVSFNPGLPPRPLSKVASGGELSRFMLALKSVLKSRIAPETLIFDEIDQGVSGHVASSIAFKMQELATNAQVLAVTHLPQVAAIANTQVNVSKALDDGLLTIRATTLSVPERIEVIGSMISAGSATAASKVVAQELLAFRKS